MFFTFTFHFHGSSISNVTGDGNWFRLRIGRITVSPSIEISKKYSKFLLFCPISAVGNIIWNSFYNSMKNYNLGGIWDSEESVYFCLRAILIPSPFIDIYVWQFWEMETAIICHLLLVFLSWGHFSINLIHDITISAIYPIGGLKKVAKQSLC